MGDIFQNADLGVHENADRNSKELEVITLS